MSAPLTQPWPTFNTEVGAKSYWLLFSLNIVALVRNSPPRPLRPTPDFLVSTQQRLTEIFQVSVIPIPPETKGISLERMEKIFGEVDFVEAGERETAAEKIEATAYSTAVGATSTRYVGQT
jgi:hypothetical protein